MTRLAILENIVKNLILLLILVFTYPYIKDQILIEKIISNPSLAGDVLVAVSIITVTACFGNFAFTYERTRLKNFYSRFLAHTCTGLLMLIIGMSLLIANFLTKALVGEIVVLQISFMLLYIASILYDFWDIERCTIK
ncbi:MAG: hypothetical protein P1V18_01305 [Candidatus Gracilibacteria bacterium]|nr:hypothetical protein [Candidatus Gracilibacteria bacterium]